MTTPPDFPALPSEPLPPPPIVLDPRREDPPWTGFHVLMVALFAVGAIVFSSLVAVAVLSMIHGQIDPGSIMNYPVTLVAAQGLAYLITLVFILFLLAPRSPQGIGIALRWPLPAQTPAFTFIAAGIALAVLVQLASRFLPIPPQLPIEQYFKTTPAAYAMAVMGILIAPFFEELFFRGLLYPVLARRLGMAAAVLLCGISFALIHGMQLDGAWAPLLLLSGVGLVFTIVRARTLSLAAVWLMHTAYNATLMGAFFVSTNGFRNLDNVGR